MLARLSRLGGGAVASPPQELGEPPGLVFFLMACFDVGDQVFVAHEGEDDLFHGRLILGHVQGGGFMIMTPDADVYLEQLDRSNPDLSAVRLVNRDGALPFGISPINAYRLPTMGQIELERVLAEGAHLASGREAYARLGWMWARSPPVSRRSPWSCWRRRRRRRRAAPAARGEAVHVPLPPEVTPSGGLWVLGEPGERHDVGAVFELLAEASVLGDRALCYLGGSVSVFKRLPPGERVAGYAQARSEFLSLDPRIIPRRPDMSFSEAVSAMTAELGVHRGAGSLSARAEERRIALPTASIDLSTSRPICICVHM